MKWLLLLVLSSCGTSEVRGLETFGAVSRMKLKLVNTKFNQGLIEEPVWIRYVVNNRRSCFPPGFKTSGKIYTVRYEDHEVLMYSLLGTNQVWEFDLPKKGSTRLSVKARSQQEVRTASCNTKHFFGIGEKFDRNFVSFIKE